MNLSNTTKTAALLAAAGLLAAAPSSVHAAFEWSNITQNGNPDVSGQLQMTVSQQPGGEVDFSFRNYGPVDSVITEAYFDYGSDFAGHLGVVGGNPNAGANWIVSSPGVSFGYDGAANFPGGNSLAPQFSTDLAAGATPPPAHNGIENSTAASGYDWLTLKLWLGPNDPTYAQLIDALSSGSFRVGVHVQSIGDNEGSDSYVTTPVPEPTTVLAGILLLVPFVFSTARFLRSRKLR